MTMMNCQPLLYDMLFAGSCAPCGAPASRVAVQASTALTLLRRKCASAGLARSRHGDVRHDLTSGHFRAFSLCHVIIESCRNEAHGNGNEYTRPNWYGRPAAQVRTAWTRHPNAATPAPLATPATPPAPGAGVACRLRRYRLRRTGSVRAPGSSMLPWSASGCSREIARSGRAGRTSSRPEGPTGPIGPSSGRRGSPRPGCTGSCADDWMSVRRLVWSRLAPRRRCR